MYINFFSANAAAARKEVIKNKIRAIGKMAKMFSLSWISSERWFLLQLVTSAALTSSTETRIQQQQQQQWAHRSPRLNKHIIMWNVIMEHHLHRFTGMWNETQMILLPTLVLLFKGCITLLKIIWFMKAYFWIEDDCWILFHQSLACSLLLHCLVH